MISKQRIAITPRMQEAIAELHDLIASCYPEAMFTVSEGDDPEGIDLNATVDVEDMGEVVDVFLDRMVDFQVEEGLPVYVVILPPPERVIAELRSRDSISELAASSNWHEAETKSASR